MNKEWAKLEQSEKHFIKNNLHVTTPVWQDKIEKYVPGKLDSTLDAVFYKAFQMIFEQGTGIIEKTYDREKMEQNHKVDVFAAEVKKNQKSFRIFDKRATVSKTVNMAFSTIEGVGILLKSLQRQQEQMYVNYEQIAIASGYRAAVPESQQTHTDFWLYSFAKQLEYYELSKKDKTSLLQALLDTFGINNPMSAMEYYTAIAGSSKYISYINNCFVSKPEKAGLFWSILGSMSGNDGD